MKYYFGDNTEYGADDIKRAFGVLAAVGGIELGLSDGKEQTPSDLNRLIASAVASGVVTESNTCLRLEKRDGGYYIRPGKAVFSDGGVVEVEEETKVDVTGGKYLYIAYGEMLDEVYFLVTASEHSEGGGELLIPIAYVDDGGNISDRRVFARGKLPALPSATWNVLREVEMVVDSSTITHGSLAEGGYVEARHPIDGEINFMMVEREVSISTMYIGPGGAEYHLVVGGSSSNFGHRHDYLGVGWNGSFFRATYLGQGPGYIDLRYHFPRVAPSERFTYKALVGIKN